MANVVRLPGSASLVISDAATLMRPETQVFDAMLEGWCQQRMSRNLRLATVVTSEAIVRAFQAHSNEFPWTWTPAHFEEWTTDLRTVRNCAQSTTRTYQASVRMFLRYACDPMYGWDRECETRFGSFPTQICHAWNSAVHRSEFEGKPQRRALSRAELQLLFDAADDIVDGIRAKSRKGYLTAFRNSVMIKVAYGWGLRRRELTHLEVNDFASNPKAPEYGRFGVCNVRWGKADAGSPPKRRGVLTVWPWSVGVIGDWVNDEWPACRFENSNSLWPSERQARVSDQRFNAAFNEVLAHAGLPSELTPHCLRHSYVTHLIEDNFDGLFVQQQVGHEHASTTSIYTSVSSDYRTRVLRAALDEVMDQAASMSDVEGSR